jgi:hypothetical protein
VKRRTWSRLIATLLAAWLPTAAQARTVAIPTGTRVYGELEERVTSRTKKDGTSVGDLVRAHVWRDVIVDGQVVIPAGAGMLLRVSRVKKSNFAGIKGKLELEAVAVQMEDGSEIPLYGGYDKSGHGRKALSITLAAVVAWPLIFIKGKHAVLEPGTVFDAHVRNRTEVRAASATPRTIRLGSDGGEAGASLEVEVLYDDMDESGKSKLLPVELELCGAEFTQAAVVTINGAEVPPVPVQVTGLRTEGDCVLARGDVDLKQVGKSFRKGINRFEIEAAGRRAEVVLDIEL